MSGAEPTGKKRKYRIAVETGDPTGQTPPLFGQDLDLHHDFDWSPIPEPPIPKSDPTQHPTLL
jgi:hypothetical protein